MPAATKVPPTPCSELPAEPPSLRSGRSQWSRRLAWAGSIAVSVLLALPLFQILASEGTNLVAGDEARPLLQFIDPAFRGQFDWRELYDASYQNSSSHILTYLLYYAVASFAELNYNVFIVIGVALATLRLGLLMLVARTVIGAGSPLHLVLLPTFTAISFSKTQISNYEFGFIAFPFGLVTCAFLLGLWAIARFGRTWKGVGIVASTGILISLASGLGPIAWATYGVLLLGTRSIRWRYVPVLSIAILVSASPYFRSLFGTGSYKSELARQPFSPELYLKLVGLPIANAWEQQVAAGVVMLLATALLLLPLARYPRRHDLRVLLAPLGLVFAGLLMSLLLTVLRGFVVWYYVFTGTLVLFGLALIAAYHLHRFLVRRERSNVAYVGAICTVLAAVLVGASHAQANQDHLAKTIFMRWRSPVSESCVRNWQVAPTTCEFHLAPWAPGSVPTFTHITERLGETTARHGLHPFSREQAWRLQGDYALDTVRIRETDQEIGWTTPGDAFGAAFEDHRRLDLQLPAPSELTWTVHIPADAEAVLHTASRMHPRVAAGAGADGAEVDVSVQRGRGGFGVLERRSVAADASDWSDISVDLSRFEGELITLRFRSRPRASNLFDTVLLRHPVIEVRTADEGARRATPPPVLESASGADAVLDLQLESLADWDLEDLEPTGDRHQAAPELRVRAGASSGTISRTLPGSPCLDGFTHLVVDMRLEDPWGTAGHDLYAIARAARFQLELSGDTEAQLLLPYRLEQVHVPKTTTYVVPLKNVAIPRGSRLDALRIAPIDAAVETSTNEATLGKLRLVRVGDPAEAHCAP